MPIKSSYSYVLISNLSEIIKTLNKIHKDLGLQIFTLPNYEVTENNISDYLEEIPYYFDQCFMEMEMNWLSDKSLLPRWRILKAAKNCLSRLQEIAGGLSLQSEKYIAQSHSKLDH